MTSKVLTKEKIEEFIETYKKLEDLKKETGIYAISERLDEEFLQAHLEVVLGVSEQVIIEKNQYGDFPYSVYTDCNGFKLFALADKVELEERGLKVEI